MMSISCEPPSSLRASSAPNPFVAISRSARLVIVVYFVVWRILPAMAQLTEPVSVGETYHALMVLTQIVIEFLILLPFLITRFAGSPIGWVHPLVLPAMFEISLGVLLSPEQLLAPFMGWFPDYRPFWHSLLGGWSMERIKVAQLQLEMMTLISLIATYFGFALLRLRWRPTWTLPKLSGFRIAAVFVLFLIAVLYFLQREGGIFNHMASLALGRFGMRETSGHFLVLNAFLPFLLILWYLSRPRSIRNPVFLAAFALACIMQFVVTGGRGGMFVPVAALLAAWMLINKRVPVGQVALLGLVAVLSLGALGEVRQSGKDGFVSFEGLLDFDLAAQFEKSQEEVERRDIGTGLAVATMVPREVGHLWGRSYISAVTFWVPRSLWREKPRGIGAHVASLLYKGRETAQGYEGAAYPVGAPAEAYWNFSWPGVILIFVAYGGFIRAIADWYAHEPQNPVAALVVILAVFQFSSPSTVSMVSFLQAVTLLAFTILVVRHYRRPTH